MNHAKKCAPETCLSILFKAGDRSRLKPDRAEEELDHVLKRTRLGLVNGGGTDLATGDQDLGITVTGNLEKTIALVLAYLREERAGKKTVLRMADNPQDLPVWQKGTPARERRIRAASVLLHPPGRLIEVVFLASDEHFIYPNGDLKDALEVFFEDCAGEMWGSADLGRIIHDRKTGEIRMPAMCYGDGVRTVGCLIQFLRELRAGAHTKLVLPQTNQEFPVWKDYGASKRQSKARAR